MERAKEFDLLNCCKLPPKEALERYSCWGVLLEHGVFPFFETENGLQKFRGFRLTTPSKSCSLVWAYIPINPRKGGLRDDKLSSTSQVDYGIELLWPRRWPGNCSGIRSSDSWYLNSDATGLRHYRDYW